MPNTYEFSVPGVVCAACATPIENQARACKELQVISADVALINKTLSITVADTSLSEEAVKNILKSTIEEIGFDCVDLPQSKKIPETKKTFRTHLLKGLVGIITGSAMLGLCISGIGVPLIGMYCLAACSTALTLYLGKETYYEAAKKLIKSKTLTMDSLFSISTLMAIAVSLSSLFIPWLPMMYDAALLIFGFRHIGKAIEESAKAGIVNDLNFRSRAPLEIELKKASGEVVKSAVADLKPGDVIIVHKGQILPVDGLCADENTSIYTTLITGRSLPQHQQRNDKLRAGSRVPNEVEMLTLIVTASEKDSYLALLDAKLKQAEREKAPLETAAKKILQYFVPTVLAIALVSALVIGTLFSPLTAIQVAAAILVSACPCTFGLITPLAIKIGIVKAAADGVRFKSGKTLEAAQQVDTVLLDLNGTLTTGILRVNSGAAQVPATNLTANMLDYLAAIEAHSSHPFALAIRQYIYDQRKRPLTLNLPIKDLDQSSHCGLVADIQGETFVVGNKSMLLSRGFNLAEIKNAEIPGHQAEHVVYLARGRKILGCILLSDPLRKDAVAVVQELQRMGKEVHICTGADQETAARYAKKLGIVHIAADCLAESENSEENTKTRYIRHLTSQGRKVAMIGDAGNDAPAIETSHFGIAVESNCSDVLTQQKAGAVINRVNNKLSLRPIITALTVANQTVSNIKQNLALSLSYNMLSALAIGGLLIGLGFVLNPAFGAALMILQTVFVLANAQRFKKQKIPFANDAVLGAKAKPDWESTNHRLRRELPCPEPEPQVDEQKVLSRLNSENKARTETLAALVKESASDGQLAKKIAPR